MPENPDGPGTGEGEGNQSTPTLESVQTELELEKAERLKAQESYTEIRKLHANQDTELGQLRRTVQDFQSQPPQYQTQETGYYPQSEPTQSDPNAQANQQLQNRLAQYENFALTQRMSTDKANWKVDNFEDWKSHQKEMNVILDDPVQSRGVKSYLDANRQVIDWGTTLDRARDKAILNSQAKELSELHKLKDEASAGRTNLNNQAVISGHGASTPLPEGLSMEQITAMTLEEMEEHPELKSYLASQGLLKQD